MVSAPDGWYFATELETIAVLVEMLQDDINAMYAAKPNGSFARAQRLTGIVAPSASAGVGSATAPSASAEELEAAATIEAAEAEEMAASEPFGGWKKATAEQQERFDMQKALLAS